MPSDLERPRGDIWNFSATITLSDCPCFCSFSRRPFPVDLLTVEVRIWENLTRLPPLTFVATPFPAVPLVFSASPRQVTYVPCPPAKQDNFFLRFPFLSCFRDDPALFTPTIGAVFFVPFPCGTVKEPSLGSSFPPWPSVWSLDFFVNGVVMTGKRVLFSSFVVPPSVMDQERIVSPPRYARCYCFLRLLDRTTGRGAYAPE